jgi:hypothetical protein
MVESAASWQVKDSAFLREIIQVRCFDFAAVPADVPVSEVIREDEHDVWLRGLRCRLPWHPLPFAFLLAWCNGRGVLRRHGSMDLSSPLNEAGVEFARLFRQRLDEVIRFSEIIAKVVEF